MGRVVDSGGAKVKEALTLNKEGTDFSGKL